MNNEIRMTYKADTGNCPEIRIEMDSLTYPVDTGILEGMTAQEIIDMLNADKSEHGIFASDVPDACKDDERIILYDPAYVAWLEEKTATYLKRQP
ncbi:MAG: hypothetical protein AB7U05_09125 [Mangrovibacterium sp.]